MLYIFIITYNFFILLFFFNYFVFFPLFKLDFLIKVLFFILLPSFDNVELSSISYCLASTLVVYYKSL